MTPKVLYFGRWGHAGHFFFRPDGEWAEEGTPAADSPFTTQDLDVGMYLPGVVDPGDWAAASRRDETQSLCKLTHARGWTLIACWDRSADHRKASNSTFLAEGTHTFDEMLVLARAAFPSIVRRIEEASPLVLGGPR